MMTKGINIVWANPRVESLTAYVASSVKKIAIDAGYTVNDVDLYRMNFDPRLNDADEPDFNNPKKIYSEEVRSMAADLTEDKPLVVIFPIWWYMFPSIMKGYLDRVWNYGLTYGEGSRIPAKKIIWIPLIGETEHDFTKRGNTEHLKHFLNESIAGYSKVKDSEVMFLFNTVGKEVDDIREYNRIQVQNVIKKIQTKL